MAAKPEALCAKAEKALAIKGLFGFGQAKPDYDVAMDAFTQAGNLYKAAKNNSCAADCFCRAAECQYQVNSLFLAAKSYETGAVLMGPGPKASDIYKKASNCYLMHGSPDRAAEMLEKAADAVSDDPAQCVQLLKDACEIYQQEDRMQYGAEVFRKTIAFCIRANMLRLF